MKKISAWMTACLLTLAVSSLGVNRVLGDEMSPMTAPQKETGKKSKKPLYVCDKCGLEGDKPGECPHQCGGKMVLKDKKSLSRGMSARAAARMRAMAGSMDKPIYDRAMDVKPLKKGEMAPDGTLVSIDGKEVGLKTLISQKPTILIFYRGGWCPFCNRHLGDLVEIEPALANLGYQILAISPEMPARLATTLKRNEINYTLLSDRTMDLTRQFGLAYRLNPSGGDITEVEVSSGNSLHLLPVPAAFVLDKKGVIRFVYFNPDFKDRVDPNDLLEAAQKAKEGE